MDMDARLKQLQIWETDWSFSSERTQTLILSLVSQVRETDWL